MKNGKGKCKDIDEMISRNLALINQEKEQKIVNLFIEMLVSLTLRECYEKSDKIFEVQSSRTEQWINRKTRALYRSVDKDK